MAAIRTCFVQIAVGVCQWGLQAQLIGNSSGCLPTTCVCEGSLSIERRDG